MPPFNYRECTMMNIIAVENPKRSSFRGLNNIQHFFDSIFLSDTRVLDFSDIRHSATKHLHHNHDDVIKICQIRKSMEVPDVRCQEGEGIFKDFLKEKNSPTWEHVIALKIL